MRYNEWFFSVIIPVYNVEKYLSICMESVLKQTFQDYEIILVDDRTPDRAGLLCDEYAARYNNVIVIHHKENGGLSAARNTGIRAAKGKYLLFVDSDDYISHELLERLYEIAVRYGADVIPYYGFSFTEDNKLKENGKLKEYSEEPMTGPEYYKKALYDSNVNISAQKNAVMKKIVQDNGLQFQEGILHEDELWTPMLYACAKRVQVLNYRGYYYRSDNVESITRSSDKAHKRAMDRTKLAEIMSEKFRGKNGKLWEPFHDNIAAQYMYGVYIGFLYRDKDFQVKRLFPLREAKSKKYKYKALLFLLSPRLTCMVRRLK
nr:glycosyltransferase [uncultured Acetatifactor sp.]